MRHVFLWVCLVMGQLIFAFAGTGIKVLKPNIFFVSLNFFDRS